MTIIRKILFLGFLVAPVVSTAHHAIAGRYDPTKTIEVEGVVTSLLWRNPHVQVSMRVIGDNEIEQDWSMATTSLSNMRRWQIGPDFIEVGDAIRVAGNPARIGRGLYIYNVLTSDGDEVLLGSAIQPRWTDQTIEMSASRRLGVGNISAPELGIFRVWSTPDNIPMLIPRDIGRTPSGRANLTEAALRAVDAFVWERDNPLQGCMRKGMPLIMEAPYPFAFTQDSENIYWHNEEYDTVRTIHMKSGVSAEGQSNSLLGYSIGYWEDGRTLVVTTTHMDWGHFDGQGIPASTSGVSEERFTLSELGERLDYSMTFSDPENLIEPMTFGKYWVWYPDAEVNEYACSHEAED
ncbi:MAG: DUF6152 family protein [Pseudomonadota bacterium]|nr:DUF6152 family protein [Pseudomonadota bacterium]